jgi:phosphoserine phosphatase
VHLRVFESDPDATCRGGGPDGLGYDISNRYVSRVCPKICGPTPAAATFERNGGTFAVFSRGFSIRSKLVWATNPRPSPHAHHHDTAPTDPYGGCTIEHDPPLFVDLDGTLTATDTLIESLRLLIRRKPYWAFLLPLHALRGRAAFKETVARLVTIDATRLRYREGLIDYLRGEKAKGRRLILATAAHRSIAESVAHHLGIFDAVIASDRDHNQKGAAKLASIRAVVGDGAFDYIGDSTADLPIFRAARVAILVSPSKDLLRRARACARVGRVFD